MKAPAPVSAARHAVALHLRRMAEGLDPMAGEPVVVLEQGSTLGLVANPGFVLRGTVDGEPFEFTVFVRELVK